MLVLTRRLGEAIIIDGDIRVEVLGIKGNQIRLGIRAPKDVSVNREELEEQIKKGRTRDER